MFELKVENKYGEVLTLSQNPNYAVKSIDGIDPPDAVINTARNANADGSVFNSAYVDNRTITITLAINQPTEANRIALYKYFKSKYPVAIYFKNDSRDVVINGYVQSIPIGYFEKKEIFQVTIFCPEPFFEGVEKDAVASLTAEALFEFPFDISVPIPFSELNGDRETLVMNEGDVETGALFKIHALGNVVNPVIINVDTNKRFAFNVTLQQGDEIILNTVKKQKSVKLIRSNGIVSNLLPDVAAGATWFELKPFENIFTVTASSGIYNMNLYIDVRDKFQGV